MGVIIGIDVGGSTTKIVGLRNDPEGLSLIEPQFVRANDPITATYGAFGKFTDEIDVNDFGHGDIICTAAHRNGNVKTARAHGEHTDTACCGGMAV